MTTDGPIRITDQTMSPAFAAELRNLTVKGTNLSTTEKGSLEIALQTDGDENILIQAEVQAVPLKITGKLSVKDVPLARYALFYEELMPARLTSGMLALEAGFTFAGMEDERTGIADTSVILKDLRLEEPDRDKAIVTLPKLTVQGVSASLAKRVASIGDVTLQGATLTLRRDQQGAINLLQLVPDQQSAAQPDSAAPVEAESSLPWTATLKHLGVRDATVNWQDATPSTSVSIPVEAIELDLTGLSLTADAPPGNLELGLNVAEGAVKVSGTIDLQALSATLDLSVQGINAAVAQPYLSDIANVKLERLLADTTGKIRVSAGEALNASYAGDVSLRDLQLKSAVDSTSLASWERLELKQLQFDLEPLGVTIDTLAVHSPKAHVERHAEGRLNLQSLLIEPEKTASAPPSDSTTEAQAPSAPRIQIETVSVADGSLRFVDYGISPSFRTDLTEFQGSITGLSSMADDKATVDLTGKLLNSANFMIAGDINPLSDRLFADIIVRLDSAGLSSLSPYTAMYAGYNVHKGKLSLDLAYKLNAQELIAENHILLDQFEFGDRVESKHTLKLPLKMAFTVLKDRNGKINVDVPIRGRLDDPEFRFWKAMRDALVNLTTRVALSPLDVLGSVLKIKENLQEVDFLPGESMLTDQARNKLTVLASVLAERPELRLDIRGQADPLEDRTGLQRVALVRQLRELKYADLAANDEAPASAADLDLLPGEPVALIQTLYTSQGLPATDDTDVMRRRLMAQVEVSDDAVHQLADQRAKGVHAFLVETLDAKRLFVIAPLVQEDADPAVYFKLK